MLLVTIHVFEIFEMLGLFILFLTVYSVCLLLEVYNT